MELLLHSTLQMLTNIENRLEELFEQIERLPPDRVELAKKVFSDCLYKIGPKMSLAFTCSSCGSMTLRASRIKTHDLGTLFVNEGERARETTEDA